MRARSEEESGQDRTFGPTSGVVVGWLGIGLAALLIGSVLLGHRTLVGTRFMLAGAVFAVLVWCFMLRPRVVVGPTEIELRNPFASWHVPLAGIRRVAVRVVIMVYTDERRFDGVAIGRPIRSLVRGRTAPQRPLGVPGLGARPVSEGADASRQPKGQLDVDMLADYVVEHVLLSADRAREAGEPSVGARRTWAWPQLVLLVVLTVALVVSLLL